MLNRLCAHIVAQDAGSFDEHVVLYRSVARELSHISQCMACTTRPEVMAVIATVTQHMCVLCEKMLDRLLGINGCAGFELRFGAICVDDGVERAFLCHAMVSVQVNSFGGLLARLKRAAAAASMAATSAMFHNQETKLAASKVTLARYIEALNKEH